MKVTAYDFSFELDWKLIRLISDIDRFDANWSAIERNEGEKLRQLRHIATIRSVASSTRIEGSKMSDEEVDRLLQSIHISKLEDRDAQEVVGYFDTLDLIAGSPDEIELNEGNIKNLHNVLMKYSEKDAWHKGNYKKHSNAVEATYPDGTRQLVFQTSEPGYPTANAMQRLIDWYNKETEVHPLVKTAIFTYEFLSVHPFQDGNGRLSRLLCTLLLLKNNYKWIQYVSFEHEIENRKSDYYRALRNCQAQRPNETITEWINFYFEAIKTIQGLLMNKFTLTGVQEGLAPREKSVYTTVSNYPGLRSGQIAQKLAIPASTVKRLLADLVEKKVIGKRGNGRGTSYYVL
jgi:Fic family protein